MKSSQPFSPNTISSVSSPYFEAVTAPESPHFYPQCANEMHMKSNEIYLGNTIFATLINRSMLSILERIDIRSHAERSENRADEVNNENTELPSQTPPTNTKSENTFSVTDEGLPGITLQEINLENAELFNHFFGNAFNRTRTPLKNITNNDPFPSAGK